MLETSLWTKQEKDLRQAIQKGDLETVFTLERGLGRPLRIPDELKPLAAICRFLGRHNDFKSIVDERAVTFFSWETDEDIISRHFGDELLTHLKEIKG